MSAFQHPIQLASRKRGRELFELTGRDSRHIVSLSDHYLCARILGNSFLFVDSRDRGTGLRLAMNGFHEPSVCEVLINSIRSDSDDVFVDCGTSYGYYSILAGKVLGEHGRVVGIEANPRCVELLEESVRLNGLKGVVEVRHGAVWGSADGPVQRLSLRHGDSCGTVIRDGRVVPDENEVLEVPTISVDSLGLEKVTLIKVDIEGAEEEFWRGAQETINRNPGIVVILEVASQRYKNPTGFFGEIESVFPLRRITNRGIEPTTIHELVKLPKGKQVTNLYLSRNSKFYRRP